MRYKSVYVKNFCKTMNNHHRLDTTGFPSTGLVVYRVDDKP